MTALEILKLCQAVDDLNTRPIIKDIQNAVLEITLLEQRIAELEQRIKDSDDNYYELSKHIKQLEAPKTCDGCKHRVINITYAYTDTTIHKCNIRDQLHFNGSCDGLVCDKYEPKETS